MSSHSVAFFCAKNRTWSNQVLQDNPQGPLGKLLTTNCPGIDDARMRRDAVSTFGFAGHGTPNVVIHVVALCYITHLSWYLPSLITLK